VQHGTAMDGSAKTTHPHPGHLQMKVRGMNLRDWLTGIGRSRLPHKLPIVWGDNIWAEFSQGSSQGLHFQQ